MFEATCHRWKLRKLHSAIECLEKELDPKIEKAASLKDWEQRDGLISCFFFERGIIDDEIRKLESDYFIKLANKLLIPIPKHEYESEAWEHTEDGRSCLSITALTELRSSVRKELKERDEHMLMWATGITGVIGALIGLVSVIFDKT